MNVVRLFVAPALYAVEIVLWITMWVVIIRAVISWVEPNPHNPIVRTLRMVTDPLLRPIQRVQWRLLRGQVPIDFSPLVLILAILVLRRFIAELQFMIR